MKLTFDLEVGSYYVLVTVLNNTYINPFGPHNRPVRDTIIAILKVGWGTERLRNLPKVTRLTGGLSPGCQAPEPEL